MNPPTFNNSTIKINLLQIKNQILAKKYKIKINLMIKINCWTFAKRKPLQKNYLQILQNNKLSYSSKINFFFSKLIKDNCSKLAKLSR